MRAPHLAAPVEDPDFFAIAERASRGIVRRDPESRFRVGGGEGGQRPPVIVEAVELRQSATAAPARADIPTVARSRTRQRGEGRDGRARSEKNFDVSRWRVELQIGIGYVRDVQRPMPAFGRERPTVACPVAG